LQGSPSDALEIAVHANCRLHDSVNLFFAFGPLAGDGFFLAVQIPLHRCEGFDDWRRGPVTGVVAYECFSTLCF